MDEKAIYDGILMWIGMVVIVTFHEFGHAYTAWRCGDDTAYLQGRVTLNPLSHIEIFGTVLLPLLAIGLSASGSGLGSFIIGWGRPVPVNLANLRRRTVDDILVSMAGPAMNVALAVAVMAIARAGAFAGSEPTVDYCISLAALSMFLCFFNLLPIPPLDGSRVLRYLIGMTEEAYMRFSQWGFVIIIVLINLFPVVFLALAHATKFSIAVMSHLYGSRWI
ncbi:MAG: site-2 protease family protein [Verrucomicrobiota bacterium]